MALKRRPPLSIRLTQDQESWLRETAQRQGISLSEFMKTRILKDYETSQAA